MDRRDMMKAGLCYLGGSWLLSNHLLADQGAKRQIVTNPDLAKNTFPLKLRPFWLSTYGGKLHFLKSLLERFGKKATLEIWEAAFKMPDDGLMEKILAEGWIPYEVNEPGQTVDDLLAARFAEPVEGVAKDQARALVEQDHFIAQAKKKHPALEVQKEINTYSSLHMRLDGAARLAEAAIAGLGKQGELVIYDIARAARSAAAAAQPREATAVIKEWADFVDSKERNAYTTGLGDTLVKATESEIVMHVTACEWARYFTERHPSVGYMIACSTDDAEIRSTNEKLRMQRTSTIMEGGKVCDFRIYTV